MPQLREEDTTLTSPLALFQRNKKDTWAYLQRFPGGLLRTDIRVPLLFSSLTHFIQGQKFRKLDAELQVTSSEVTIGLHRWSETQNPSLPFLQWSRDTGLFYIFSITSENKLSITPSSGLTGKNCYRSPMNPH